VARAARSGGAGPTSTKSAGSPGNGERVFAGDNANFDFGQVAQTLHTHAVPHGKAFHFFALRRIVHASIGEHTVAVGEQQLDLGGLFFDVYHSMI
jgi:hypothetical protein